MSAENIHPVVNRYLLWKEKNDNDEDYCYDCITDFFDDLSRGDLCGLMEWAVSTCNDKGK